jgi:hypothetical protein
MNYSAILIAPLILLLIANPVYGFVKMDLPKTLQVGSAVIIHGTSAPSNATRTNCTVAVNINNEGYQAANMSDSGTTWTYSSSFVHTIKLGDNRITAKFMCFSPTNSTEPTFIHHHSENVTGVS